jgi:CRISPR-associated protein Cas5t
MEPLWLRVRAPFAAFRGFQSGVYRATSPVMPHSTAYGLVLNLASIEMRGPVNGLTTEILDDLPKLRIAVGLITQPETSSLYQQLHSYRVGTDAATQKLAAKTKGSKYWIIPVRRELLVGYNGMIGVQTENSDLLEQVRSGLQGKLDSPRYGLPFAGDNNLLIDQIDVEAEPPPTCWYSRMQPDDPPRKGSCRLTVGINRADNSKTTSYLYAPTLDACSQPPDGAWTWVPSELGKNVKS